MLKRGRIVIVLISILFGCSGSDTKLLEKLKSSVNNHIILSSKNRSGYSVLTLSNIADFEWDKFYVFDEYVTSEEINGTTGIQWNGSTVPSGQRRLFFIKENEVVKYVDYRPIDFPLFIYECEPSKQYVFYKKDDTFIVFKKCNKDHCIYGLVPYRCKEDFKRFYKK
ncbi:hypothetical protein [Solitalea canadensis]|uniref:Lipoprotein n=1 Tax=Solitalea canadensis (strain ATCC 29591 / DSM 3403 / JCM 21819 / LMG 8368 / NBRC 15130 / NCIMB 12057 / USAM 9D) TaxID=929556 RepID=H8KTQ9_SOLCM|nr:hypothetical protein [Solitalea canadensis]AFD06634.1 hypothetical protein Solca_1561 [Solitalea canadensis DSM 3403]